MENSSNISMNKAHEHYYYYSDDDDNNNNNNNDQSPEESGWTMYLEDDFLLQNNDDDDDDDRISCDINNYSFNISSCESSLISDAGSPAKKLDGEDVRFGMNCFNRGYGCNRLSFKRRKTVIEFEANNNDYLVDDDDDDALKDTATSPGSSPKVCQTGVKRPKGLEDNHNNMFEEEEKEISKSGKKDDKRSHEKLDIGRESDSELKKRGLCLVPLSVFVNYIG